MGHSILKADYPLMINWFKAKGYSGSLNEMIIAYFKTLVGNIQGYPNDLIARQMNSIGLTGNVGDMLNRFFCQKMGVVNPNDAARLFFSDSSLEFTLSNGIDSYTKLMLHMDSNFTDSSLSPKTVTLVNTPTISSTQSKFGGSSGKFVRASSQYLTLADSADWNWGSGTGTIDFWVFFSSMTAATLYHLFSQDSDASNAFIFDVSGSAGTTDVNYYVGGSALINIPAATSFTTGIWYHVALIKGWGGNANDWAITVNGSQVGSTVTNANATPDYSSTMQIGQRSSSSAAFDGYMDELRFSKGIARWTSNFTPPTVAYS